MNKTMVVIFGPGGFAFRGRAEEPPRSVPWAPVESPLPRTPTEVFASFHSNQQR